MKHPRSHLLVKVVRWKFVYDYWDFVVSYSLFVPFIDDPPTPKKSTLKGHHNGEATFNFLTLCLFCGQPANVDVEKKKGVEKQQIYEVRVQGTIDSTRCVAAECKDGPGWQVLNRLSGCIDLVATEGRYYKNCQKQFFLLGNTSKKRGRPQEEDIVTIMQHILSKLEDGDDCQYSISELLEDFGRYSPDVPTIKRKLVRKYDTNFIVMSNQRQEATVCFKNVGKKSWPNVSQTTWKMKGRRDDDI